MTSDLPKIDVRRFSTLVAEAVQGGQQMAFFLGAGCSVSSGVLPASTLCLRWIRELKRIDAKYKDFSKIRPFEFVNFTEWYRTSHPTFNPQNAGQFFAQIIKERFPNPALRRLEVQRFVEKADPAIGYRFLSSLMVDERIGSLTNVVLTTNFDDLIHDALYIFYHTRPFVIAQEDIAKLAIPPIGRPLVFKLHGDAFFEPLNTPDEVESLADSVAASMSNVLLGRGLIFMGYSGGDSGVIDVLRKLPSGALRNGVYWVNERLPTNELMKQWLVDRKAVWVNHNDFDTAMMSLAQSFNLQEPPESRFIRLLEEVSDARGIIERKLAPRRKSKSARVDLDSLKISLKELETHDVATFITKLTDVAIANPGDVHIKGYLAQKFVIHGRNIEGYQAYREALSLDPDNVMNLCHLASVVVDYNVFSDIFEDRLNEAERLLRRACRSDPFSPLALGTLASFLWTRRRDRETAGLYFERALQADPRNAETLASYANYVWRARGLLQESIDHYRSAVKINPSNYRMQANLSQILFLQGDNRAFKYARTVLSKASSNILKLETAFYLYLYDDIEKRSLYVSKIKLLIDAGIRSPGWDLGPSVDHAAQLGRDTELAKTLSNVISNGTPEKRLLEYREWGFN